MPVTDETPRRKRKKGQPPLPTFCPKKFGDHYLDWIIAGAESGHGARTMHMDWVRSIRDQCVQTGVDFFLKQFVADGGMEKYETPELDGRKWTDIPASPMKASS